MQLVSKLYEIRRCVAQHKAQGQTIGVVLTLGNIHEGHLSLIREARKKNQVVIASIYLNPTQFSAHEDFDNYPRTKEQDCALLAQENTDILFLPQTATIYPNGTAKPTQVKVPQLDGMHCGKSRPIFFTGVATVVCKLLSILNPDQAFFGEKDFQQLAIIRRMVSDLFLPVKIQAVPTCRNRQGLALSSRNSYLSAKELALAPTLYQTLCAVKHRIQNGHNNYKNLEHEAKEYLEKNGFILDYFTICACDSLLPANITDKNLVILAAVYLGKTRLIDNISLSVATIP